MTDPGRRLSGGAHSNGHPEIANALLEGIERSDAPIVALDLSGCIQFLSQGFAEMAGVSKTDTVVGAPSKLLFPDGSVPRNANDRKTQLQSLSNGTSLSVNWQPNPAGGWIGTAEAPSSESAAADGTSAGEMVDPLTKVGTRLALNKAYEDLRLTRGPDDIAVLCIDLDHFKKVNDTFGHLVGDAVLKKAAERLRMATRPTDFVARFGGDEFVILIADDNIVDSATSVAERLIEMLSRSFLIEGHLINIGASVGASRAAEDGKDGVAEDLSEMFRRADVALYDAKEGGRGRHIWHEPVMDE